MIFKRRVNFLVALAMILSCVSVGAKEMSFKDVNKTDWFYNDVKTAFESGIINGKTDTEYAPDDNMTYAEAIKLAACMHQQNEKGEITLKPVGEPWYTKYVEYCDSNDITSDTYNYDDNATRAGYMNIFANCLPDEDLAPTNSVADDSIPDVPTKASYAKGIYKLYRAGILTGVDDEHNCNPNAYITRAEVAAIITRMTDKSKRLSFKLGEGKLETEATPTPEATTEPTPEPSAAPLKIEEQPKGASGGPEDELTLNVKVSGGVEPYTYEWNKLVSSGKRELEYAPIDDYENGNQELKLYSKYLTWTEKASIICKVTDAEGNSVSSETATVTYTGDKAVFNERTDDKFLMYVKDAVYVTDVGMAVTGKILSGTINLGDDIYVVNSESTAIKTTVERIVMFKKNLDSATKGDTVQIVLGEEAVSDFNYISSAIVNDYSVNLSDNSKWMPAIGFFATLDKWAEGVNGTYLSEGIYTLYIPEAEVTLGTVNGISFDQYISLENDADGNVWISTNLIIPYIGQRFELHRDGKMEICGEVTFVGNTEDDEL